MCRRVSIEREECQSTDASAIYRATGAECDNIGRFSRFIRLEMSWPPPRPDPRPGMSSEGTTIKRSRPALPSAANFQFSDEFFRGKFDDNSADRRICMKFASQGEQGLLSLKVKVSFRSSGRKRRNRPVLSECC